MTMADRIAVMAAGRVSQVATPAELYEAPNSRFVAGFIGDINIFDGKLTQTEKGTVEITLSDGMVIRTRSQETAIIGAETGFAVRPEKIRVTRNAPTNSAKNAAKGTIWDIGYLGDMTVYHVKLDSGQVVKASAMNAVREVENPLGYDEEVWISFDENAGVVLKD